MNDALLTSATAPSARRELARWAALVAATAAVTGGCQPAPEDVANGDDPIAALEVPVRSTRYDGPYWQQQRLAASDTWRRAAAACTPELATQRPNCEPVIANERAVQGNARADSLLRSLEQRAGSREGNGSP